jgi:hypothetical protein
MSGEAPGEVNAPPGRFALPGEEGALPRSLSGQ